MELFFTVGPIALLGVSMVLFMRFSAAAELHLQELEDADRGE